MAGPLINSEQLGRLLDRNGPALRLYAAHWCAAPDDCVQEALIELARQSPPPEAPVAWLFSVVKRRAQNQLRGQQRRTARESSAARPEHGYGPPDLSTIEAADLLAGLCPDARELVVLRVWGGLTFQEIAEVTARPASSLHREYGAAIERLRRLLEPHTTPRPAEASHDPQS